MPNAQDVVSCPACGGAFDESKNLCGFCHQGVRWAGRGLRGEASETACPRCDADALWLVRFGKVVLDVCPDCAGAWFDLGELEHVVQTARQEVRSGDFAPDAASGDAALAQQKGGERVYLRCPRCEVMMNRVNFERRSGIIIDVCREHGMWLDGGEFQAIRSWAARHPDGPPQPVESKVKPYEFKTSSLMADASSMGSATAWLGADFSSARRPRSVMGLLVQVLWHLFR